MKQLIQFFIIMLAMLPSVSFGQDERAPDFKIELNSSGLTVITVSGRALECVFHTLRKDLVQHRASMESYDKHTHNISLTETEVKALREWAGLAVQTKVTDEQQKDRRGYRTTLLVIIEGKSYSPNHDKIKEFQKLVERIVEDRRKQ